MEQLEQILIAFRENHFEVVPDTEDHVGQERLKFQLEAIGHHIQLLQEEAREGKHKGNGIRHFPSAENPGCSLGYLL